MKLIQEQFTGFSTVIKSGSVKGSASGTFNGNEYDPSVRITCTNIYEMNNQKLNCVDDVEQKVVFKIPCPNNEVASKLLVVVKNAIRNGGLKLIVSVPNDNNVCVVLTPLDELLNLPLSQSEFKDDGLKKK